MHPSLNLVSKKLKFSILGGGISGLSTAYYLNKKYPQSEITLFEKKTQLGGKINTKIENNFTYETAANGVLSSHKETFTLAKKLGLEKKIIQANKNNNRYFFRNGKLNLLPNSKKKILNWKQISFLGKISLFKDFFLTKNKQDISIDNFAKKHFGKEIAAFIINPICNGIFGSDSSKLSLRCCFPFLYNIRKEKGSILKGMIQNNKNNINPLPILQSFHGGMQILINQLEKHLVNKISIIKNSNVDKITNNNIIHIKNKQHKFDYIISTLPLHNLSKIINNQAKEVIQQVKYNKIIVVCLGYINHQQDQAFGYLVPNCQKPPILGVLYSSSIFPENNNYPLYRIIFNTEKIKNLMTYTNLEIINLAKLEIKKTLKINESPKFEKVIRWNNAIPIYQVNHHKLVNKIEQYNKNSTLIISGNGLNGFSVNNCIKQSIKIIEGINL